MALTTHWSRYVRHWHLLRPPLRPNAEVVERVRSLIGAEARCLLLGSTMEFAALSPGIVSMDASHPRLAVLWRSADPGGLAIQGDWTRMPVRSHAFSHVLGDGSLNAVAWSVLPSVLGEVTRVLRPGRNVDRPRLLPAGGRGDAGRDRARCRARPRRFIPRVEVAHCHGNAERAADIGLGRQRLARRGHRSLSESRCLVPRDGLEARGGGYDRRLRRLR